MKKILRILELIFKILSCMVILALYIFGFIIYGYGCFIPALDEVIQNFSRQALSFLLIMSFVNLGMLVSFGLFIVCIVDKIKNKNF